MFGNVIIKQLFPRNVFCRLTFLHRLGLVLSFWCNIDAVSAQLYLLFVQFIYNTVLDRL